MGKGPLIISGPYPSGHIRLSAGPEHIPASGGNNPTHDPPHPHHPSPRLQLRKPLNPLVRTLPPPQLTQLRPQPAPQPPLPPLPPTLRSASPPVSLATARPADGAASLLPLPPSSGLLWLHLSTRDSSIC
uniref:Uncharacterized protein n=1 Tax=Kalanchoe fedtschenkoi TaxID=63787 RepID=A0A7N0VCJ6_KALFE